MDEIEQMICTACRINPNFINLTTQQQYEWLHNNLDSEIIKEELEHYYDSKFEYVNNFDYKKYK